ncbi:hypothetical protein Tco_0200442 [Tanacetum coccineum]
MTTNQTSNNSIQSILKKEKLNGSNFLGWYHNLRIILGYEQKMHHLEEALPEAPPTTAIVVVCNAYIRRVAEQQEVACLMLAYDCANMGTTRLRWSCLTSLVLPTFIASKEKGASEEKGVSEENEAFEEKGFELDRGRRRRLHPLGEYVITLYKNGKLRTKVTVALVSGAEGTFFEGHTPKGVGLRVADSHTGNHLKDDFTPLETFGGFSSAFGM